MNKEGDDRQELEHTEQVVQKDIDRSYTDYDAGRHIEETFIIDREFRITSRKYFYTP